MRPLGGSIFHGRPGCSLSLLLLNTFWIFPLSYNQKQKHFYDEEEKIMKKQSVIFGITALVLVLSTNFPMPGSGIIRKIKGGLIKHKPVLRKPIVTNPKPGKITIESWRVPKKMFAGFVTVP
jgi:hypothetical protein